MVVFTCNNCGDSVTKPKVEKHMQYECKRKHFAVSFCCVDCLKDFNFETVKDHCQCVTEEQRYSAKGFVPKASSEKGKRKQAGWVDIVQSVIERKDLPNDERQFLNIIAKFDNVPRKKNKFQNFCFSSAPAYRRKAYLVDKVFDMIEAEYKTQQALNSNEKSVDTNNIKSQNDTECVDKNDSIKDEPQQNKGKKTSTENSENNAIESTNNDAEEMPKKKKKKSKQSIEVINDEIKNNSEEPSEKKKKKKEQKLLENGGVNQEKHENTTEVQLDPTKKSKKKKKSEVNESNGACTNGTANGDSEILIKPEIQMSKKEKKEMKKKMKYQHELETVANGVVEADQEPITKKKKRKMNDNAENEEPQQKIMKTDETSQVSEVQSGRKFEWNEAINQVLQNKKNKTISISKVMKRVMNEYHFLNKETKKTESELEKIFLKKLRKMKNVLIDNDKVKLVDC